MVGTNRLGANFKYPFVVHPAEQRQEQIRCCPEKIYEQQAILRHILAFSISWPDVCVVVRYFNLGGRG